MRGSRGARVRELAPVMVGGPYGGRPAHPGLAPRLSWWCRVGDVDGTRSDWSLWDRCAGDGRVLKGNVRSILFRRKFRITV